MVILPFYFIFPGCRSGQAPVGNAAGNATAVHIFQDEQGLLIIDQHALHERLNYDALVQGGREKDQALELLRRQAERYDPDVLEVLEPTVYEEEGYYPRPVSVKELEPGMVLAREVRTKSGLLLLVRGQQVNEVILMRLESFSASQGIKEPVYIRQPLTGTSDE